MWVKEKVKIRYLVPVRTFDEEHMTKKIESERGGRPVRRPYLFRLPGAREFLLAVMRDDNRFSIVTTKSNASVAPVHGHMPLVLRHGESVIRLDPGFARLANRSEIKLESSSEGWEAPPLPSNRPRSFR